MIDKLKVGSVSYTNAIPLTHFLPPDLVSLEYQVPSQLCEDFKSGKYQVALLPVFELFKNPHYRVVPGLCIGSKGAVGSVSLFYEGDFKNIKKVQLDSSSRTSNALVRVVLEEFLGIFPEYVTEDEAGVDAQVKIGDPALKKQSRFSKILDLGEAWTQKTGYGFAYALWVTAEQNLNGITPLFQKSLDQGERSTSAIIEQLVGQGLFPREVLEEYFKVNMHYRFDQSIEQGLKLFYQYCRKLGLVENEWTLKFYESNAK